MGAGLDIGKDAPARKGGQAVSALAPSAGGKGVYAR
jgi:hypothetical protein